MADLPEVTNVLLSVVGNLDDPAFHECRLLATAISEEFAPVTLEIKALVETDYLDFFQYKLHLEVLDMILKHNLLQNES